MMNLEMLNTAHLHRKLVNALLLVNETGNAHTAYRPGDYTCGVPSTVTGYASCHSLSPENATHLAGTGVQVLIYMGQMRPASSSVGGSVDARLDSHTDFHLQQKIEYKSGFNGNDYKNVVYLG